MLAKHYTLEVRSNTNCKTCTRVLDQRNLVSEATVFNGFFTRDVDTFEENGEVFIDVIATTDIPLTVSINELRLTRGWVSQSLQECFTVIEG